MSRTLYLDTARLGLMSPSAQRLQNAFARFAGDPHGLLYFEEFLRSGLGSWPNELAEWSSELTDWRGIDGLAASVRRLTHVTDRAEVLFASRSATLMKLASNRLATDCRRVLTVDLLWPLYRRRLVQSCRRSGAEIAIAHLRSAALRNETPSEVLAEIVCEVFVRRGCDSLVLPLIDHRGTTLPVGEIVRRLTLVGRRPRYVVVDASQALGHVPVDIELLGCDLLISGAHKWVGGYQPLGIGVASWPTKQGLHGSSNNDPLLLLTREAAGALSVRHGETAAVLPLITAAGALADLDQSTVNQRLKVRFANRRRLGELLEAAGWQVIRRRAESHGILIARPESVQPSLNSRAKRRQLAENGVAATAYANGLVRFSLPHVPFSESDLGLLQAVLNTADERTQVMGFAPLPTRQLPSTSTTTTNSRPGCTKKPDAASWRNVRRHHGHG